MTCGWSAEDFMACVRAIRPRDPEGRPVSFTIPPADFAALRDLARLHGLRPHEVARAVLLGRLHGRRAA